MLVYQKVTFVSFPHISLQPSENHNPPNLYRCWSMFPSAKQHSRIEHPVKNLWKKVLYKCKDLLKNPTKPIKTHKQLIKTYGMSWSKPLFSNFQSMFFCWTNVRSSSPESSNPRRERRSAPRTTWAPRYRCRWDQRWPWEHYHQPSITLWWTNIAMEHQWPCSIAMLVHQSVWDINGWLMTIMFPEMLMDVNIR